MKRTILTMLAVTALMVAPLSVLAASHEHGSHGGSGSMGSMNHGTMPMKHDDMKMGAGMAMLGEQTVEGVKAMAHVKDVKAAMAKAGMKETHHFMVNFVDKGGKPVTTGTVAVKIKSPSEKEGEALALMGMDGHFGADVILDQKGEYQFQVGSKLADGVTRQFEFKTVIK